VKELDNLRSSYENTLAKVEPAPEPPRQAGDAVNLEADPQTQAVVDTVARVLAQRA